MFGVNHRVMVVAAAAGEGWRLGVLTLNWCPPLVHAFLPVLAAAEARVWSNRIDARGVVSNSDDWSGDAEATVISAAQLRATLERQAGAHVALSYAGGGKAHRATFAHLGPYTPAQLGMAIQDAAAPEEFRAILRACLE